MKNFIFWVGTTIGGVQYPHELIRYCPPIYVLCVSSHLWTVPRQIKFWPILIKSWDWARPPPLCLDKIPSLPEIFFRTAPLSVLHLIVYYTLLYCSALYSTTKCAVFLLHCTLYSEHCSTALVIQYYTLGCHS